MEIICKDCGIRFRLTQQTIDHYKNVLKFDLPKRCKKCKAEKKVKYEEEERYFSRPAYLYQLNKGNQTRYE